MDESQAEALSRIYAAYPKLRPPDNNSAVTEQQQQQQSPQPDALLPRQSMSTAATDSFDVGEVVEIHSLTAAPQHNGKIGKIVGFNIDKGQL